jgi:putative endonuclease
MRAGVTDEEAIKLKFFYTYVLSCSDSELYVGHAKDLRVRLGQHKMGKVPATAFRLPVELVYYEACLELSLAQTRERQLKTGYGRSIPEKTPWPIVGRSDAVDLGVKRGARYRVRTCDPYRVKVVLYH